MQPKRSYLLSIAISSALAFSAAVIADDPSHKGHGADAAMQMMDANQDGKVTATEHASGAKKMFEKMDADQDGKVTALEMDAARKDMPSHGSSKPMKTSAEKIKAVDTNKDGAISAQEHAAGSREMFSKMDADQDGALTTAEIKAGHEKLLTAEEH